MNVIVQSITHDDPNFIVFRASDVEQGNEWRYVSSGGVMQRCPQPGECWSLEYTEVRHEKYGAQRVVVRGATIIRPNGSFIRSLLAKHPALRGLRIGEKTAQALYDSLGAELVGVLDRDEYERLSPVLDYDTAVELCDRWHPLHLEPELLQWLDKYGIEGRIASKLIKVYGAGAITAITENPYALLPFFPFKTVDSIARDRFGIEWNDPRRMVAATETILYDGMQAGHTALRRSQVLHSLHERFGLAANALELALQQQVIFASSDYVRAYAPAVMEQEIEAWVRTKIASSMNQDEMLLLSGGSSLEALITAESNKMGIGVTEEQRKAVLGALTGRISCIAGGAGVGKTTVLRLLAAMIADIHGKVCFMAVTGRAAKRIRESLGADLVRRVASISTVARFVNSVVAGLPPDSTPWLIIDEASMLDLQGAHRIFECAPAGARLVFVGDPGQLPPIGAGLVYHRLMDCADVPRNVLTTVFRQAGETGIPRVTEHVRNGEFYDSDFLPFTTVGQGVQLQPASGRDAINEAIRIRDAMAKHGEVQILTLFKGEPGAMGVNRAMHARVPHGMPQLGMALNISVGEPVIYLQNDTELDLQNGSVGVVQGIQLEPREVTVLWDDGIQRGIAGANLANLALAHGITTHKAQGSQYERVVIIIPRPSEKILDRSLIYTALTRAQKQAVIVGDVAAVRDAIRAEPVAKRRTVLFLSNALLPL